MSKNLTNKDIIEKGGADSLIDSFTAYFSGFKKVLNKISLAFIDTVVMPYNSSKGYGICKVKPFPYRESEGAYTIEAYFFNANFDTTVDVVLLFYTDANYKPYVNEIKKPKNTRRLSMSDESNLHTRSGAVIINL